MKWFKHMSDMLDDLFVVQLISNYGPEGYGVWCGLLEIYARYSGDQPGESVVIPWEVFEGRLQRSRRTFRKLFQYFSENNKISFKENVNSLEVSIPKMLELKDEWTRRREKNSGVTPDKLPPKKKEEKKKDNTPLPPKGEESGFDKFWKIYPKKTTKQECIDYWKSKKLDSQLSEIINGLNVWKMTDQWQKDDGKFIPDPIRFLKKRRWEDELTPVLTAKGPSREETIRQAWKDGRILTHHFAGRHHPESLKPVDPGYRGVGIDEAVSLEAPDGKAYPLREWRIDEA